jgi:hypothetical protein
MVGIKVHPMARLIVCQGLLSLGLLVSVNQAEAQPPLATDPFKKLEIYDGDWTVRADRPWSGAPTGSSDRLRSLCQRFSTYFACEQTVNQKPVALIVYTAAEAPGRFHTRTIATDARAGGRGDLVLEGNRWTYLDKPPQGLKGPWSRTENTILDNNRIRFAEYQSSNEGKTWTQTNAGLEVRQSRIQ